MKLTLKSLNVALTAILIALLFAAGNVKAQVIWLQKLQEAEAMLNKAYQSRLAVLGKADKERLRESQRDWLKQRTAYVAANPQDPAGAQFRVTINRVGQLSKGIILPSSGPQIQSSPKTLTVRDVYQQLLPATVNPPPQDIRKAEALLNKVYQELIEKTAPTDIEKLRQTQREWLKQREAYAALNAGVLDATYGGTVQRIADLVRTLNQMDAGNRNTDSSILESKLARQDELLNSEWRKTVASLEGKELKALQEEQKAWIQERDAELFQAGMSLETNLNLTWRRTVELRLKRDFFEGLKNRSLVGEFDGALDKLEEVTREVAERLDAQGRKELHADYLSFRASLLKVINRSAIGFEWFLVDDALLQRRIELIRVQTGKVKAQLESANSKMPFKGALAEQLKYSPELLQALPKPTTEQVEPVYQSIQWNAASFDYDLRGEKYRLAAIGNTIHVFDAVTRLLLGTFEVNVGGFGFEESPPQYMSFLYKENFVYCEKSSHKTPTALIYHLPSLKKIIAAGDYRGAVEGPIMDDFGNFGFYESQQSNPPQSFDNLKDVLDKGQLKFVPVKSLLQSLPGNDREFFVANPAIAQKLGIFLDKRNDQGVRGGASVKRPVDASEGEKFPAVTYADLKLAHSRKNSLRSGVVAVELRAHSVLLHRNESGRLSTGVIAFSSLTLRNSEWSGPKIFAAPISEDPKWIEDSPHDPRDAFPPLDTSKGEIALLKGKGNEQFRCQVVINGGKHSMFLPPRGTSASEGTSDSEMPGAYSLDQMLYNHEDSSSKSGALIGYWSVRDKTSIDQLIGVYSIQADKWIYTSSIKRFNRGNNRQAPSHFYDRDHDTVWVSVPESERYEASGHNNGAGKYIRTGNSIECISLKTGASTISYKNITDFETFSVSDRWIFGLPKMEQPYAELWSREPLRRVMLFSWDADGGVSAFDDSGYYAASGTAYKNISMKVGGRTYPFEQFDARLNRPDIIFKKLGYLENVTEPMFKAYQRRLKKLGLSQDMLKPEYHLPTIQFEGRIASTTSDGEVNLPILATDTLSQLHRIKVYVNGVPVNGVNGEGWGNTKDDRRSVRVKLGSGRNKIQVSVVNISGGESLFATAEVTCTAPRPKPVLYVVSMGVSRYVRPEYNLRYAAKDAEDVAAKIKAKAPGTYSEVRKLVLKDEQVTKEALVKVREFLSGANTDDAVLIFMAGHGILDDNYDYYFGTSDIDPAEPGTRGIAFEEMNDILARVGCLKKAMLVDTCHAGELDEDEKRQLALADATPSKDRTVQLANKGVAMRAVGMRGMRAQGIDGAKGRNEWHERLQDMFVDLRRGSGTTIITSSAGAEYAFESSEQQNGLFTYALLEGLDGMGHSQPGKDGLIKISQLAEYVKKRVAELTQNKQTPNVRRVNLEEDFTLVETHP